MKDSEAKPVEVVVNRGEIVDIQVEMRLIATPSAPLILVLSRRRRRRARQNRAHNYPNSNNSSNSRQESSGEKAAFLDSKNPRFVCRKGTLLNLRRQ